MHYDSKGHRVNPSTYKTTPKTNTQYRTPVLKTNEQLNSKKREEPTNNVPKERSIGTNARALKTYKVSAQTRIFYEKLASQQVKKYEEVKRQSYPSPTIPFQDNTKFQKIILQSPLQLNNEKNRGFTPNQIEKQIQQIRFNYEIDSRSNTVQESGKESNNNLLINANKIKQISFQNTGKKYEDKHDNQINKLNLDERIRNYQRAQQHISKQYTKLELSKAQAQNAKRLLKQDIIRLVQQKEAKINELKALSDQITRKKLSLENQCDKKRIYKGNGSQSSTSNRILHPSREQQIQQLKKELAERCNTNQMLSQRLQKFKVEKERQIKQKDNKIESLHQKWNSLYVQKQQFEKKQRNRPSQKLLSEAKCHKEQRQKTLDLEGKLQALEKENKQLKQQLIKRNQIGKQQNNRLLHQYSKRLDEKQMQNKKLTKQKEALLQQVTSLSIDKRELSEKLQSLRVKQSSFSDSRREITQLNEQIKKRDEDIHKLQTVIKRNQTEKIASISTQNKDLSKKIVELTEKIASLTKERQEQSKKNKDQINRLKLKYQSDKKYYDCLQTTNKRLQQQNKQLNAKVKENIQTNNGIQQKYSESQKQLQLLTGKYINDKNEQTAMQNSLRQECQRYEKEIKRNKEEKDQLARLKVKNTELIRQNDQLKSNCQSLGQFNKQLEDENKKHKKQIQKINSERKNDQYLISQSIGTEQALKRKYQQQIDILKTDINKRDQKIKRLQGQKQELIKKQIQVGRESNTVKLSNKKEIQSLNNTIRTLQSELIRLKMQKTKQSPSRYQFKQAQVKRIQSVNDQSYKLRQVIDEKERQIVRLNGTISSKALIIQQLQENNQRVMTNNDIIQKKYDGMIAERNSLQKKYLSEMQKLKQSNFGKVQELNLQIKKLQKQLLQKEMMPNSRLSKTEVIQSNCIGNDKGNQVLLSEKIKLQKKLKDNQMYLKQVYQNNQRLQKSYNGLNQQCKRLQADKSELLQKITELQQEKSQMAKSSVNSRVQINQHLSRFPEKQDINKTQSRQIDKFKKEIQQMKQLTQRLQDQLHQFKMDNQNLEKVNVNLKKQFEKANKQKLSFKDSHSKLEKQIDRLKEVINTRQQQKRTQNKEISQNNWVASPRANKSPLKEPQRNESFYNYLFHGQLLRGKDQYKMFIKQSLEKYMHFWIQDTRLIYKYDPLNPVNLHKYIDLKENLVVLVKLMNGNYLAGYAQGYFKAKTVSDRDGVIMSLSNSKCYYLVERNKRSITYDDYFIIFGNSEIRIKSGEKKMFSNFGLSNSYFKHNGDGVDMLLGGSKTDREMELQSYEFHQLILKP